jgi:4'-phosphopantetheinyl transferase EntD
MKTESQEQFKTLFGALGMASDALHLTSSDEALNQFSFRFDSIDGFDELNMAFLYAREPYISKLSKRRKFEFLAGRFCALRALEMAGAGQDIWLCRDLVGLPVWPAGWVGSISHTRGLATALVAPEQEYEGVGIDVEGVMSSARATRLASKIWAAYPPPETEINHAALTTLVFSVKEALYKALNPIGRLTGGFDSADVVEWDFALSRCLVRLRDAAVIQPQGVTDYEARFDLSEEWATAMVVVAR